MTYTSTARIGIGNLQTAFQDLPLVLDNLIRLRLIKETDPSASSVEYISLTDLGFRFMNACRFM